MAEGSIYSLHARPTGPLLLLDTGSPLVSVAVARDGAVVASRSIEQQRSSAHLLDLIGEVLAEAGITVRDLGGIAVLRGPGSFTGLRIGLATVLGLHQALGVPATALPSLQVMAAAVEIPEGETVIAAVDALRGDWSAQAFAAGPGSAAPGRNGAGARRRACPGWRAGPPVLVGFGVSRLAELPPGLRPRGAGAARSGGGPGGGRSRYGVEPGPPHLGPLLPSARDLAAPAASPSRRSRGPET